MKRIWVPLSEGLELWKDGGTYNEGLGKGEKSEARGGSVLGRRRLRVLGWKEEELGDGAGIWEEMRGAKAWQKKGLCEGWREGNQWAGGEGGGGAGQALGPSCTALAGGRGGCGGWQPAALRLWVGPSDTSIPVLRNTATKMKTRPLWSTARPTSPTR